MTITDQQLWASLKARVSEATDPLEAERWAAALKDVAIAIGIADQHRRSFDEQKAA